jgi:hypothetical protein
MPGLIEKYCIKPGQVFISSDGSRGGHLVLDTTTFAHCDDVVTQPFTASGIYGENLLKHPEKITNLAHTKVNRIDAFKLACVRYHLADPVPSWVPDFNATSI